MHDGGQVCLKASYWPQLYSGLLTNPMHQSYQVRETINTQFLHELMQELSYSLSQAVWPYTRVV